MNEIRPMNSSSSTTKWLLFVIGSLCVISLLAVAVLVAIALPLFQQRREAARREATAANLKSLGLAIQNYEAAMVKNSVPPSKNATEMRTVDVVREVVAMQLGVELKLISGSTSLAELGADDLDLVELIMELEEHFSVNIPEESISALNGKAPTEKVMEPLPFGELTMLRLAEIVDQRREVERK